MGPARILVVDNDPWIQRMVATVLGQRGHLVSLAGDAQGALASATKVPPDLVITTVSLPAVDGWAWWQRLRARPELAATPILFLSSSPQPGESIPGLEPEHDQRIPKPFRVEDLERVVAVMIGRLAAAAAGAADPGTPWRGRKPVAEKATAGHRPLSALRGALDEIQLSSVLVLLEMEHKTGILLVERDTRSARCYLRKGRVIRADTDGPERLTGAAALYELLTWSAGAFDFLIGDVGGVDDIQSSTTFLLMEAARRIDERRERERESERAREREQEQEEEEDKTQP